MTSTRASFPRPRPRSGRRAAAAIAAVACLGLALTGCGSLSGSSPGTDANTHFVAGTGQIIATPQGQRPKAPDISGETVDGGHLSLADYRGKVVVLNVWGSWCDPCRGEAPNLAAVARADANKGVRFVGINTRDYTPAQAQRFEHTFNIPYPSLFDPNGQLILKFPAGTLPPQSIPTTLIIDRQGRIAVHAFTALTEDQLNAALNPIIAEK